MKPSGYPLDVLYQMLFASPLKTSITGKIEKNKRPQRPADTFLEDVILNLINITGGQIQLAATNVNLHVPDIEIRQNGLITYASNESRMDELEIITIGVLNDFASQLHTITVSGGRRIEEPEIHSHYVNLRVDFQIFP